MIKKADNLIRETNTIPAVKKKRPKTPRELQIAERLLQKSGPKTLGEVMQPASGKRQLDAKVGCAKNCALRFLGASAAGCWRLNFQGSRLIIADICLLYQDPRCFVIVFLYSMVRFKQLNLLPPPTTLVSPLETFSLIIIL